MTPHTFFLLLILQENLFLTYFVRLHVFCYYRLGLLYSAELGIFSSGANGCNGTVPTLNDGNVNIIFPITLWIKYPTLSGKNDLKFWISYQVHITLRGTGPCEYWLTVRGHLLYLPCFGTTIVDTIYILFIRTM